MNETIPMSYATSFDEIKNSLNNNLFDDIVAKSIATVMDKNSEVQRSAEGKK